MNEIQPGMFVMILQHIWVPLVSGDFIPVPVEAKVQVVGLTKVICETPSLLQDANGQQLWVRSLTAVAKILTSQQALSSADSEDVVDSDIGYDPTFSRLHFASRPQLDPFKSINATQTFTASFQNMMATNGGIIQPLMQQGQTADPKTFAAFENLISRAGI
jgi:exportin-2 (importin alpha re-exporter)